MLSPPLDILRRALRMSGEDNLDGAIELLLEGVELCEREAEHRAALPRLASNLTLFYRRQARYADAIVLVRRSLESCPGDRSLLHNLADLLISTGDWEGAALAANDLHQACQDPAGSHSTEWMEALSLLENRIAVQRDTGISIQ